MASVCVVGAGPAGCTFATRMAQFGHVVWLVERVCFPRPRLGESLSPGVLPLLEATGARSLVEAADFPRSHKVMVRWEREEQARDDPQEQGLLVDRGNFDRLLLENAKRHGVRVLQPAQVIFRECRENSWSVAVSTAGETVSLTVDMLAEAGGRGMGANSQRRRTGPRTLALHAYWQGENVPRLPRIEAGEDAWYWGVPVPNGGYNTQIFVDPRQFRAERQGTIRQNFMRLLQRSTLLNDRENIQMTGTVTATDATPYLGGNVVSANRIVIGDAALAIDPLSSSGVQKAIQGALAGAVVANTLLRRPESGKISVEFYASSLAEASERHRLWAANHYRDVLMRLDTPFWRDRSAQAAPEATTPIQAADAQTLTGTRVFLSRRLEIADLPCIEGAYVTRRSTLRHPGLDTPIAFLGGQALAPLLRDVPDGLTLLQIAQLWTDRLPLSRGLAIAAWLFNKGVLASEVATLDDRLTR